jgi:hypothetical protein
VFVIACTTCTRRQLIFPSQVLRVDGGDVVYRLLVRQRAALDPGSASAKAA